MNKMKISDLRQRVLFEQVVLSDDGGGGVEESWAAVCEVWASVRALSGDERLEADAISGSLTHEVRLRWRDDVSPDMRMRLDQRIFDLRVVMDLDGRRRLLRCFAEERDL